MGCAWERARGETAKAHQAFLVYRDMGPGRSLAKVAQELGKSKALMDRWSARWRWVSRVAEWDAHQQRLLRDEQEAARRRMARRHARIAVSFQRKVAQRLRALNPNELSPRDLAKWLEVAVKLERQARGLDDDSGHAVEASQSSATAPPPPSGKVQLVANETALLEYMGRLIPPPGQ
ncbi:hypothetical protein ACFL59_03025 [Planctomycetota bacterium]